MEKDTKRLHDLRHAVDEACIVAVTDSQGHIIFVNEKFCHISGYPSGELIGEDHSILKSGFHSSEFYAQLWETIAKGEVWRGVFKNKTKNGKFYWVDTTVIPFLNERGKIFQYIAISRDMTENKLLEEAFRELPQKIIAAQEQEKERIALDIHDDLGQTLIGTKMLITAYLPEPAFQHPDVQRFGQEILEQLDNCTEKARVVAYGLIPPHLKLMGITAAIKDLITKMNHRLNKINISFRHRNVRKIDLNGQEINLYRIVQEGLSNIVKYAKASEVSITFKRDNKRLILTIEDNGCGFDTKIKRKSGNFSRGMGLSVIRERARLLSGKVKITSRMGTGTKIAVTIPYSEESE